MKEEGIVIDFPSHNNPSGRRIARQLDLNPFLVEHWTGKDLDSYGETTKVWIISDFRLIRRLSYKYEETKERKRTDLTIFQEMSELKTMRGSFLMPSWDPVSPFHRRVKYLAFELMGLR